MSFGAHLCRPGSHPHVYMLFFHGVPSRYRQDRVSALEGLRATICRLPDILECDAINGKKGDIERKNEGVHLSNPLDSAYYVLCNPHALFLSLLDIVQSM